MNEKIIYNFLKNNFNLKEILSSPEEFRINSPFCPEDKKFHCYINIQKGLFIDYKSGLKGSFLFFVKEYLQLNSLKEAESLLYKSYGNILDLINEPKDNQIKNNIKKEIEIPQYLKFFDEDMSFIGKKAKKYLNTRGFSDEKIIQYKLGYFFDGEYKNRIFIPFFENGIIVYFITRSFDNSKLRYKNPIGFDSKEYVFNIDKIENTLVIVEGVFDALTIDYPVSTCMLSADISEVQIKKIYSKNIKNIIFIPDNDSTGFKTLENNWKKFLSLKEINKRINFYVFNIKGDYKDINESQINYISLDDCKKINKSFLFERSFL